MFCRTTLLLVALSLGSALVQAHGELRPAHGGVIVEGPQTTVEIVLTPQETRLYLSDHGRPLDSRGVRADLVLLSGGKKSVVPLQAAGSNQLSAPALRVTADSLAIVRLQRPGQAPEQLRFARLLPPRSP